MRPIHICKGTLHGVRIMPVKADIPEISQWSIFPYNTSEAEMYKNSKAVGHHYFNQEKLR